MPDLLRRHAVNCATYQRKEKGEAEMLGFLKPYHPPAQLTPPAGKADADYVPRFTTRARKQTLTPLLAVLTTHKLGFLWWMQGLKIQPPRCWLAHFGELIRVFSTFRQAGAGSSTDINRCLCPVGAGTLLEKQLSDALWRMGIACGMPSPAKLALCHLQVGTASPTAFHIGIHCGPHHF